MKSKFLRTALKAAEKAGAVHLRNQKKGSFSVMSKDLHYDLVTESDIEAEKVISRIIHRSFPNHNILGEEDTYTETDSPFKWIIDPLDGTNNFARGLPQFSVSISLNRNRGNHFGSGV